MFAVGKNELEKCKPLGDFILCDLCGKRHKIEHGTLLSFYRCGDKSYLAGIDGKDMRSISARKT